MHLSLDSLDVVQVPSIVLGEKLYHRRFRPGRTQTPFDAKSHELLVKTTYILFGHIRFGLSHRIDARRLACIALA